MLCSIPVITVISGDEQEANANSSLPHPVVVQVACENNSLLANVPVTFTADQGSFAATEGGTLSSSLTVNTNTNGLATIYFTSSSQAGFNSLVSATANFNGATSSTQASATAAGPPFRYAIIDLGKDRRPIRIANNGWVLIDEHYDDGHGNYGDNFYRWKAGVLEQLTYPLGAGVSDMNNSGVVVGSGGAAGTSEGEYSVGVRWLANSSVGQKVASPVAASPNYNHDGGLSAIKVAFGDAVNDGNEIFGHVYTGGLWRTEPFSNDHGIFNSYRWASNLASSTQLSHCHSITIPDGMDNWADHKTRSPAQTALVATLDIHLSRVTLCGGPLGRLGLRRERTVEWSTGKPCRIGLSI